MARGLGRSQNSLDGNLLYPRFRKCGVSRWIAFRKRVSYWVWRSIEISQQFVELFLASPLLYVGSLTSKNASFAEDTTFGNSL